MKRLLLLIVCIFLLHIDVVDNRDYPEDGLEVYVFETHVGYLYGYTFEYSLTGK